MPNKKELNKIKKLFSEARSLQTKDSEKAIEKYNSILKIDPNIPLVYKSKAKVLESVGRKKEAVEALKKAHEIESQKKSGKIRKEANKKESHDKISDIMVKKNDIVSISYDRRIQNAIRLMKKHDVSCIAATSEDEIYAIITEKDIVKITNDIFEKYGNMIENGGDGNNKDIIRKYFGELRIKDYASSDLITISENASPEDAIKLMYEKDIRHLFVGEKNKIVGLTSYRDVAEYLLNL